MEVNYIIFLARWFRLQSRVCLPDTEAVVLGAAFGAGMGGVRVVHRVPDHVSSRPVVAGQLLLVVLAVVVGDVTASDLLGLGPDELEVQNELMQSISVTLTPLMKVSQKTTSVLLCRCDILYLAIINLRLLVYST